ncbi:hypothetical protein N7E81_02230 [Reichenbachiella carrageenanivorans]|uniref:Uncharacterized protein n=1 Tax=Reichenbachiella carrageenanivorans TaxID=2979869 RepID=A0ABY6D178_9BACT|nr:hypothetical protein [Reichenbachiella carrageenanivorans]UXX79922.1 hypothetical protein N7E81_02230 [Reichenbachiella carrageenanivorans]
MNKIKIIMLFVILVFPVLIYLFLQSFGKNKFAIPVYYEQGVLAKDGCPTLPNGQPYHVDEAAVNQLLGISQQQSVSVYEIGNTDTESLKNNLYTFLEKYKDKKEVQLLSIKALNDTIFTRTRYDAWQRYNLADSNLMRLGRCILHLDLNSQLKADSGLVLVDQQQQIRGYYDPLELKEIDRLNTEIYILLSEQ